MSGVFGGNFPIIIILFVIITVVGVLGAEEEEIIAIEGQ